MVCCTPIQLHKPLKKRRRPVPNRLRRPTPREEFPMNHTKTGILITIYRIIVKSKKHYAAPSVDSIIELVSKRHSKDIQRRWAFQCLHDIEALGYISRRERFRRDPGGGYTQQSSIISISLKGARLLFSLGVEGAQALAKQIMGWIKGEDKRFPEYKERKKGQEQRESMKQPMSIAEIFTRLNIPNLQGRCG